MTLMEEFLQCILAVISQYYTRQTKKALSLTITATREELLTIINVAVTAENRTDRKSVLIYLVDNFIAFREQTSNIKPDINGGLLYQNLQDFFLSLQTLVNSKDAETHIKANGLELTAEGLTVPGAFAGTSLRFTGQAIVTHLFTHFKLSTPPTSLEIHSLVQTIYLELLFKQPKTEPTVEKFLALCTTQNAMKQNTDKLTLKVTTLETEIQRLNDIIAELQRSVNTTKPASILLKNSLLTKYNNSPPTSSVFRSSFPTDND